MELSIRASKKMNEGGSIEDSYIRLPDQLIENLSAKIDDTITLECKNGDNLDLKIKGLYEEDASLLLKAGYVTEDTYDKLLIINKNLERVDNLLIGCDPEFFLVHKPSRKIIPGMEYFSNASDRQIGSDGALMELRPHPNMDSDKVTDNIGLLLFNAKQKMIKNKGLSKRYKIEDIYMIGSSYYDKMSAGFHIHFGIPPRMLDTSNTDVRSAATQIANVLDYYIGIPSILPEQVVDASRRMNIEIAYGKPGDWRLQFPTFEYRVPGGFLLSDPVLTKGLLSMSWVVMDDVLSRIKACTEDFKNIDFVGSPNKVKELYPHIISDRIELCKVICNYNHRETAKIVDKVFRDIEEMVSFEKEKKSLINFYNRITSGTFVTHNIEENWGLENGFKKVEFHTSS